MFIIHRSEVVEIWYGTSEIIKIHKERYQTTYDQIHITCIISTVNKRNLGTVFVKIFIDKGPKKRNMCRVIYCSKNLDYRIQSDILVNNFVFV